MIYIYIYISCYFVGIKFCYWFHSLLSHYGHMEQICYFFLILVFQRNSRGASDPGESLRFTLEDRICCTESKKVRYVRREDSIMQLPIPMDSVSNKGNMVIETMQRKESSL